MFGKHFQSMYTGSMYGAGANVFAVWGYVIAHVQDGSVELNAAYIAPILGMPMDAVAAALSVLCAPDPNSRSPEADGCRLIKTGAFSYDVPTHGKYRRIKSEDDRRAYMRQYYLDHRVKPKARKAQERQKAEKAPRNAPTAK